VTAASTKPIRQEASSVALRAIAFLEVWMDPPRVTRRRVEGDERHARFRTVIR